ncbi:MAG: hypothetical protein OXE85_14845 [Roseovarius sp.]|nr:hypothetical protein [Roseovarius sp.]
MNQKKYKSNLREIRRALPYLSEACVKGLLQAVCARRMADRALKSSNKRTQASLQHRYPACICRKHRKDKNTTTLAREEHGLKNAPLSLMTGGKGMPGLMLPVPHLT